MEVALAVKLVVGTQLVVQACQLLGCADVGRALLDIVGTLHIHQRIEKGEVAIHAVDGILVGVVLAQVVGQHGDAVAHGDDLRCRLDNQRVGLEPFHLGREPRRGGRTETEVSLDEQSVERVDNALALVIAGEVALAAPEGVEDVVADALGRMAMVFYRLEPTLYLLIS